MLCYFLLYSMVVSCIYIYVYHMGFPAGSEVKASACYAGDLGSIPGLRRFSGEGKGYPLQYSGLENSMDCIVMESEMTE